MKKLYLFLFAIIAQSGYSQTVLFFENFGNPNPPTANPTASAYSGYQNTGNVQFSGNATIRTSTPSENYEGASGSGCVFIGGATPSQSFLIENINTSNYTDIALSLGHYKTTNAGSNELLIEVSSDGNSWTNLTYSRATGQSNWVLISPAGTIPSTSNLRLRFFNPVLTVGFRVDDIQLTGNSLSVSKNEIPGLKLYPNPVTGGTLYIDTNAGEEKTIAVFDVLGKQVIATKTTGNSVNVSRLNSGVYIIKISEEGKTVTRKLVIK